MSNYICQSGIFQYKEIKQINEMNFSLKNRLLNSQLIKSITKTSVENKILKAELRSIYLFHLVQELCSKFDCLFEITKFTFKLILVYIFNEQMLQ